MVQNRSMELVPVNKKMKRGKNTDTIKTINKIPNSPHVRKTQDNNKQIRIMIGLLKNKA